MSITWDGSLAMGLPEIDEQHHRFVDLLAKLEQAVEHRTEGSHLPDVFDELAQYVKYHFSNEEHHFDEFGCYANAEAHRRAHHGFREYVHELRYRFLDDAPKGAAELARAMYEWLRHHIASMDREYAECFRAHGMGNKQP